MCNLDMSSSSRRYMSQAMRPTLLLLVLAAALVAPAATASLGSRARLRPRQRGPVPHHRGVSGSSATAGGARRPEPVVLFAHMSNRKPVEWVPEARRLAARGIFAFAFDFRGHGLSQGTQRYGRLGLDVAAAVKVVRRLGAQRIVVAGAWLGGIAAVVGAATTKPQYDGVVSISGPAVIAGRIDARPFAPRLQVPHSPRVEETRTTRMTSPPTRSFSTTPAAARRSGCRAPRRLAPRVFLVRVGPCARCSRRSSAILGQQPT